MTISLGEETVVPLVDLGAVHAPMLDDLRQAFERVLASSGFIGGTEVDRFEAALAGRLGVAHVVGVSSGTAALQLALMAAGIGPGDEVVIPANTFFATAEAVFAAGATPVVADVDPETALLDEAAARAACSARTAAVIPVHLYGQPVDGLQFAALAAERGLFFLEDAAQAIGGRWAGRPAGTLGAAAAFSFYPGKNLGALGDAGAVTTSDPVLAAKVRLLRSHGEEPKHCHLVSGYCERLDGLQAAFLSAKLVHLDEAQDARDRLVERYLQSLAGIAAYPLATSPNARHAHHLFVVRVGARDAVLQGLRRRGVAAAVHYPTPVHCQPGFSGGQRPGDCPAAEDLAQSILTLPLYPGMTNAQVDFCVESLQAAIEESA